MHNILSWLQGTWLGETYFPNGSITRRISIRLQITETAGTTFLGRLINMYPNDTTVRLERLISGEISDRNMMITHNEETYIRDPRTRGFWKDCAGCATQSSFSVDEQYVVIKITTNGCGDDCNGETVFRRDTSQFDAASKVLLAEWFQLPGNPAVATLAQPDIPMATPKEKVVPPVHKDSIASTTINKESVASIIAKPTPAGTSHPVGVTAKQDTAGLVRAASKDTLPVAFTSRATNLIHTYLVDSPDITVQLFDNAEIDGDVVTVYHNGQLIANHQSLTHKAITFTIHASAQNKHHEFVMIADNLGLIAPNTALLRIIAGSQKFELEVTSDLDNNAKIGIDYTGN